MLKGEEGEPSKAQAPLGPQVNSEWSCLNQKSTQSAKVVSQASPPTFTSCPSATPLVQPPKYTLVFLALHGSRTAASKV